MSGAGNALQVKSLNSLADISAEEWNQVSGEHYPFLRHEFLMALEASGCASTATGWSADHLVIYDAERLVAIMPRYQKLHSRGEYVFDWAWADVFEKAGGDYYPKSLTAIPFSPVCGPRLVCVPDIDVCLVIDAIASTIIESGLSSWHLLFAETRECQAWLAEFPDNLIERTAVHFEWQNNNFENFEAFLATLTSKKRKEIRRERRKVTEQGFHFRHLTGTDISHDDLVDFYRCYCITYLERGQRPYLSYECFQQWKASLSEQMLLIQVQLNGQNVAAALCFISQQNGGALYGRYWGSELNADCLHFETCYYQGIEFCIQHKLARFDPGTQGEHKLLRGFGPHLLSSLHYIEHEGFRHAVSEFCSEEQQYIQAYYEECLTRLPFKQAE